MKRVWPLLAFIWGIVIIGIAINLVSAPVGAFLKDPQNLLFAGAALLVLAAVSWVLFRSWRRQQLAQEFAFFTSAERLRPEDLGFQVVAPGGTAVGSRRPYYADTYVPRVAVAYAERHLPQPTAVYDEPALVSRLEQGGNLLLIGQPT